MKAIFEVTFKESDMYDKEDLKRYGGSPLKLMKWLYQEEGLGIFLNELKLVEVKK